VAVGDRVTAVCVTVVVMLSDVCMAAKDEVTRVWVTVSTSIPLPSTYVEGSYL
jgi:hypothetical protein